MTDELVDRLRAYNDESFVETLCGEAADRIEALTFDRENRLADLRIIKAERDRLRAALEDIIADCEADYPPSHGAIKYAAKLALKGETP